jgi:hypothetical protein
MGTGVSFPGGKVAEAHEHVQRLVSVVKMATVFEGCTTEEHTVTNELFEADTYSRVRCVSAGEINPWTRYSLYSRVHVITVQHRPETSSVRIRL